MKVYALLCAIALTVGQAAWGEPAQKLPLEFAKPGHAWSFPRDHGPHYSFQTEWWYFTGQLFDEKAEPFRDKPLYGFQLTFFRRAQGDNAGSASDFLAHAALTDLATGVTHVATRKGGGLLGVAGARDNALDVWAGDWSAELIAGVPVVRFDVPGRSAPLEVRLRGAEGSAPWLQGDAGYSRKGACESCASQYYSMPRLELRGEVQTGGSVTSVRGLGWMDHEFMTNSLSKEQVGWDWMGLMLKDGRNLMGFRLRTKDGRTSYVSGSIQDKSGAHPLTDKELTIMQGQESVLVSSGGRYPASWHVTVPQYGVDTVVHARTPQCEIGASSEGEAPRYWEGPVASSDESVIGYLEMTGYAGKVAL